MTTGQKIAEYRKRMGLSQEKLGEQLGVSRQAISKWEADAALPEVEKLAALSKLFGVTVGWLLGLEESVEQSEPLALNEKQLEMIEALIKHYTSPPPSAPSWKKLWPQALALVLCCALAVWCVTLTMMLATWKDSMNLQMRQLDTQISEVNGRIPYVPDYDTLYDQLEKQLQKTAGKTAALAACQLDVAHIDVSTNNVTLRLTAKPRIPGLISDGKDIAFTAQHGKETYQADSITWDGATFVGEITLPAENNTHYFLMMPTNEGLSQLCIDDNENELCDLKRYISFELKQADIINIYTGYNEAKNQTFAACVIESYGIVSIGGYEYYFEYGEDTYSATGDDNSALKQNGFSMSLEALYNDKSLATEVIFQQDSLSTKATFDLPKNPQKGDVVCFRFKAELADGRTSQLDSWAAFTYTGTKWEEGLFYEE